MKRNDLFYLLGLSIVLVLSGCVVRTYPLTKERVDQSLIGNRGYLKGQAPAGEGNLRETTRTTQVVEIELRSPIKFEKAPKQATKQEPAVIKREEEPLGEGNRGYISQSVNPEIGAVSLEKYTVQKGDTLQKISKKFYGTTKKWNKIYEANKDTLKAPDKIRVGQVLNIPTSPELEQTLQEPKENLK